MIVAPTYTDGLIEIIAETRGVKKQCILPGAGSSNLIFLSLKVFDETYIEYAGTGESLEQFAIKTENIIICKSMSKVYALSGIRAAYLCCSPHFIETLKSHKLKQDLIGLGVVEIIIGIANFILFYLPQHFPPVDVFLKKCQEENLFLRDLSTMGKTLGKNAVRIAVKDEPTIDKMIAIMERVIANNGNTETSSFSSDIKLSAAP